MQFDALTRSYVAKWRFDDTKASTLRDPAWHTPATGSRSGILDMQAGDVIERECHVKNKTDGVLGFTDETYAGEMCITAGFPLR